ncbi:outer membrane beta-barrel protein [Chryseolinea lacunae]|uniref:Outer membrane beta-barrel protein n=1 Tax=Chryseolinea lacunae TaxID=2801331 RepID=A0ABS1KTQ4_9BACT|nr:outer membrane beta-barrel protein [Chryseolinea lacunae]MBL0742087.1 outer membrane beta-barrel protein [Chryseolinea lacunae]
MLKKLLLLLFVCAGTTAVAQKLTIQGQLVDSAHVALPAATLMVLSPKDSSLVNFGTTQTDGSFQIKNLNAEPYLFKVTFVGYAPLTKRIDPQPGQAVVDLGVLSMQPKSSLLAEVTVEADRAPVTLKKDTIEFNAESFKTVKQNAVVEDLLKKLPGVEVDADGTIRAQGEQVQRVMVDGKPFFGTDPKLATRNLPADAIKKVQVFDKKSDQAAFSGIDDGQREKTINLELKEEKRKGFFGNATAGFGSNNRYAARASLNRFTKGEQISFLGMANNVNDQGFSIDDYMTFTGGSQQMARGGGPVRIQVNSNNQSGVPLSFGGRNTGIMSNYGGGLNYNKTFNTKTELNSSYFFNALDHNLDQYTDRINYFPTGNLTFNQTSRQHNTNQNHRLNTVLDHKIDSLNSLRWTTSLAYNQTDTKENSSSKNLDADGTTANEGVRQTASFGNTTTLNSTLLWRHKFAKKGRTLSTNLTLGVTDTDRDGQQDATTTFYGENTGTNHILQTNRQDTRNNSYGVNFSYTEPLGHRLYLEANYAFRSNLNDVNRLVYDLNNGEATLNTALSNQYTSDYQYHRGGLNFRMNRSKYNLTVGSTLQQTYLDGDLKLTNTKIEKSYQNILPVARFNYDFTTSKHLRLDYEASVQEPSLQQLQPVVDNSDPLNMSTGNPDLSPAYAHDWRFNFTTFNPANFSSFFVFVDATLTRNAITTSQTITDQQVRISKPVNVDRNMRVTGNATYSFPFTKLNSRFGLTATATRQNGVNVLNDTESNIAQNTVGGTFRYNFRYKEIFDLDLSANLSRQSTDYEFNTQADQLFFNKTYSAESNLSFLKHYSFNTSFDYLVYQSITTDYEQSIPLFNLSVSRFILKNKSGELKFAVNNLLDKNLGVSQQADVNYFQRQTTNSLGRYFLVSFTYALNKHLNPMGARPRGGMIRIQR